MAARKTTDENQLESMDILEAIREANRCLNCKTPKCQQGCPISNDIPEFIEALGKGNIGEARKIIARKSNLPAVCGRVCAHELQCQGHCVLAKSGEEIQIGKLERFIADFDFQMELPLESVPQKLRGKVAVIGSGPAGLTVAGDLAKMGFAVTVYDALPEPGGILLYGIPSFRLPKDIVRREISRIKSLGVNFVTNSVVGQDINIDEMQQQGYDAIFIGTGTAVARELDIPNRELNGIIQSTYLLRMKYLHSIGQLERHEVPVQVGDRVLIIGAGNVAIDAARTAKRLGADSITIISRNSQEELTARQSEYQSAVNEGIKFSWNTLPIEYVGENSKLTGLLAEMNGERKVIDCDKIFLAIGSRPANRIVSTTNGIDVDEFGYVVIKERPYGMTSRKSVFAGGDVVHRPATVVLAMKEAKKVAVGIAEYVDAVKLLEL